MEELLLSKYNLNNIPKEKNENEKKLEDKIVEKVQNVVNNKEEKINNQIVNLQKQIKDNIDYLNNLKLNNNNNYIILQVKIDNENLNKYIRLFNQVSTYKYYSNFERDDIEIIIDDQIVPIKFKIGDRDFSYYKSSKNCRLSEKLEYYLSVNFFYY